MNTHIRWKYVEYLPVENESKPWHDTQHEQRVPHIMMCTQKRKLFEFLKYNNICSFTTILNESISKLCGLSAKYAQIWGTLKITPCNIRSSTEYEARVVWMNDASQTKIR